MGGPVEGELTKVHQVVGKAHFNRTLLGLRVDPSLGSRSSRASSCGYRDESRSHDEVWTREGVSSVLQRDSTRLRKLWSSRIGDRCYSWNRTMGTRYVDFITPSLHHSPSIMSFFPLEPCCLKGCFIPGEPKGVYEPADPAAGRQVGRYVAKPSGPITKANTALILLSDAFMFNIVSPPQHRAILALCTIFKSAISPHTVAHVAAEPKADGRYIRRKTRDSSIRPRIHPCVVSSLDESRKC